jgi:hypothetical protein
MSGHQKKSVLRTLMEGKLSVWQGDIYGQDKEK